MGLSFIKANWKVYTNLDFVPPASAEPQDSQHPLPSPHLKKLLQQIKRYNKIYFPSRLDKHLFKSSLTPETSPLRTMKALSLLYKATHSRSSKDIPSPLAIM